MIIKIIQLRLPIFFDKSDETNEILQLMTKKYEFDSLIIPIDFFTR